MRSFVFSTLSLVVDGLVLQTPTETNGFTPCTPTELAEARELLTHRNYSLLAGNPCVPAEKVKLLEEGIEDPADTWEFLGCGFEGWGVDFPGSCEQRPENETCVKFQLPSFLYLGMPHSGSSSLAWQLNLHPDLSYGTVKEHAYFVSPGRDWTTPYFKGERCCGGYNELCDCRNTTTYSSEFPVACSVKQTFDASPYTLVLGDDRMNDQCFLRRDRDPGCKNFHWRAPGRDAVKEVKNMLGGSAKFIVSFRDPLDMFESRWQGQRKYAVRNLESGVGSCYADGLEGWLSVFPPQNFLYIDSVDYFKDPQKQLDRIFDFLEVPRRTYMPEELAPMGRRRVSSRIFSEEQRKEFHSRSEQINCKQRLESHTGLHFDWS